MVFRLWNGLRRERDDHGQPMNNWTETAHCKSHAHCVACRRREPMANMEFPAECPEGVTLEQAVYDRAFPEEWRNTGTVSNCCGRADL